MLYTVRCIRGTNQVVIGFSGALRELARCGPDAAVFTPTGRWIAGRIQGDIGMRKLIRVDGTETEVENKLSIAAIEKLIGADTVDSFTMADRVHVVFVDDLGHAKSLPVNEKATAIYLDRCRPGTTYQIRGDVVIVPDSDFG